MCQPVTIAEIRNFDMNIHFGADAVTGLAHHVAATEEGAKEILDLRYARGEIGRESTN